MDAKLNILINNWNKLLQCLITKSSQIKDNKATSIINKIIQVKSSVKCAALYTYLKNAQRLHTIAFFQWRLMFSKNNSSSSILQEIIEERMNLMYGNLLEDNSPLQNISNYSVTEKFYKQFASVVSEGDHYNINHFN